MELSRNQNNFYPRPPRGGQPCTLMLYCGKIRDFYPRPPRGGRLDRLHKALNNMTFLSTPSARRATISAMQSGSAASISIHALREEGDKQAPETTTGGIAFLSTPSARRATVQRDSVSVSGHISIHALREEGDSIGRLPHRHNRNFYPRPPRGGRRIGRLPHRHNRNFYPRPPRGGRPLLYPTDLVAGNISIHALREEGDIRTQNWDVDNIISIHALREEGDKPAHNIRRHSDKHFYPRPPRGGRRLAGDALRVLGIFLSTPSARRATTRARIRRRTITNFYPRPPRGGRHKLAGMVEIEEDFYPRPPRGGRPVTGLV